VAPIGAGGDAGRWMDAGAGVEASPDSSPACSLQTSATRMPSTAHSRCYATCSILFCSSLTNVRAAFRLMINRMEKGWWDEAAAQEEKQTPRWVRQGEFVKDGLRWRLPDKDAMQEPDRSRISGAVGIGEGIDTSWMPARQR